MNNRAMQSSSPENYFTYLPENRLCATLGCTAVSTGYTRIPPHSQYPRPVHPEGHHFDWQRGRILHAFQLVLISSGRGTLEFGQNKRQKKLPANCAFLLFPDVWHRFAPERSVGWTEHWIEFHGTAPDMALSGGIINRDRPVYIDVGSYIEVFEEIHQLARNDALLNQSVLSMLSLKLLALLAEAHNLSTNRSTRLVDSARMMLMERNADMVPMNEIAEELGVSYSFLRRSFKEATGMSLKEFQLSVRIKRARDFLDNTGKSIKEIAAELGFSSAFHFSTQFRNIAGQSPSQWRVRSTKQN